MEDTDWRPSKCPECGAWREAARNPICESCTEKSSIQVVTTKVLDRMAQNTVEGRS